MSESTPSVETFFCPYSGTDVPVSRRSKEHVVPEALTSGRGMLIDVARDLNNQLGEDVDGPFINEPGLKFLASTRFVSGKSGEIARYEHPLKVSFEGHEIDIKINKRGREIGLSKGSTGGKFIEPNGAVFHAVLRENDAEAERAMRALEEKLTRKGIEPVGETVRAAMTIDLGKRFSFNANGIAAGRFFLKVALGATYFMLQKEGEDAIEWARNSPHAAALRRVLFDGHDPRGPIFDLGFTTKNWSALPRWEERLHFPTYDGRIHEHELGLAPEGSGTYLYVNLFGVLGARIRVATRPYGPIVYAIAYRTGKLRRLRRLTD